MTPAIVYLSILQPNNWRDDMGRRRVRIVRSQQIMQDALSNALDPSPSSTAAPRLFQVKPGHEEQSLLKLGLFRFTLIPLEPMPVSAINKGDMLRGAFGLEFRRLYCVPECNDAHSCPLQSCPYIKVSSSRHPYVAAIESIHDRILKLSATLEAER